MIRTIVISLLALAVLLLAVGGWTVRGLRWALPAGMRRRSLPAAQPRFG